MKICVYPGSFDPITMGHLNIIERAAKIFDKVIVLVSVNPNKHYLFTRKERVDMIQRCVKGLKNVEVSYTEGMVTSYAEKVGASVILRGLRNQNDYQNELEISYFNHSINPNIETMLMYADRDNLFTSSSSIKDLVICGGDASPFLPKEVIDEVVERIK